MTPLECPPLDLPNDPHHVRERPVLGQKLGKYAELVSAVVDVPANRFVHSWAR
jgi:hypothetical protein